MNNLVVTSTKKWRQSLNNSYYFVSFGPKIKICRSPHVIKLPLKSTVHDDNDINSEHDDLPYIGWNYCPYIMYIGSCIMRYVSDIYIYVYTVSHCNVYYGSVPFSHQLALAAPLEGGHFLVCFGLTKGKKSF